MKRILFPMAVIALLGSSGHAVAGGSAGTPADAQNPPPLVPFGSNAEYAMVDAGSSAPDFAYETLAGSPARLRDLRMQGHVLLVFGASDTDLRRLQGESDRLTRMGVVPVAVLDRRAGACRGAVKKLSLTFPVVPDPQRTIGAQYNALDPRTKQNSRAWFAIDRRGRVRGLDRFELPSEPWVGIAATSLGIPAFEMPVPASHDPQ